MAKKFLLAALFCIIAVKYPSLHVDCFGEAIRLAKEKMDQKNVYFVNPAFDK